MRAGGWASGGSSTGPVGTAAGVLCYCASGLGTYLSMYLGRYMRGPKLRCRYPTYILQAAKVAPSRTMMVHSSGGTMYYVVAAAAAAVIVSLQVSVRRKKAGKKLGPSEPVIKERLR